MGAINLYHIKKYVSLDANELKAFLIGGLVLAFIISFKEWGADKFDLMVGLRNLLMSLIIVLISMFVHIFTQKAMAFANGFKMEYRIWSYGLIIGLILTFVSKGNIWILAPGGMLIYHLAGHRVGSYRYGINFWPLAMTALSGPMVSFLFAMMIKLFTYQIFDIETVFITKLITFNLWLAFFTMLPIPPLDGYHVFFNSRVVYVFTFGTFLGYALLFSMGILSLILALLIGFALYLLFYIFIEKESWTW